MGWELRAPDGPVLYQYPAVYSPFDPLYRAQPGAIVLPQTGVYSFRVHAQGTSYSRRPLAPPRSRMTSRSGIRPRNIR